MTGTAFGTAAERRSERRRNASQTRPDQTRVFVTAACGVFGYSIHPSLQAVEGQRPDAWMGANAQNQRWLR